LLDSDEEEDQLNGTIQYQKHNLSQYYHIEEVLAMVDISNDQREDKTNEKNFNDSLFNNELMQINHVSQLFIGLNVFSLLFF
jgi:hypothetical protein